MRYASREEAHSDSDQQMVLSMNSPIEDEVFALALMITMLSPLFLQQSYLISDAADIFDITPTPTLAAEQLRRPREPNVDVDRLGLEQAR